MFLECIKIRKSFSAPDTDIRLQFVSSSKPIAELEVEIPKENKPNFAIGGFYSLSEIEESI